MSEFNFPYQNIGEYLKQKRERNNESLAEVSGAVEIDIDTLKSIEDGAQLPGEDILVLLISYFNISDSEARRAFALAGYENDKKPELSAEDFANKQVLMFMAPDNRILYSDAVDVMANKQGVVINFSQGSEQTTPIARIGMSHEQAQNVIEILQATLHQPKPSPKLLPQPKSRNSKQEKT